MLQRYQGLKGGERLFLSARWAWTPYSAMASLLPSSGEIVDLGCGHGLFSLALALASPERQVTGIDHDPQRLEIAGRAARGIGNLRFERGDFRALGAESPLSGIAMIDVLHYFGAEEQEEILASAFAGLCPGGVLIFREVDLGKGALSRLGTGYERIATSVGFTRARGELHFRARKDWEALARNAGFQASFGAFSRFPFADVLFRCVKPRRGTNA